MLDLYVEFRLAIQALDTADVPYAVCGGLALMVYQRPRATVDIDIITPPESAEACVTALKPLGYRAHPRPLRFPATGVEMLRLYKLDPDGADVLTLDCLITTHPVIAQAWQDRMETPFEDREVSVVSIRGLVAMKRLRGSPMDLLDIESLQPLLSETPQEPQDTHG